MIPAFVDLAEHWSGTMFEPIVLDFSYEAEDAEVLAGEKEVGDPIDLTGVYARMTCRDSARNVIFDWFSATHPNSVNTFLALDSEVVGRYWILGPGVLTTSFFGKFSFDLKFWQGAEAEPWKYLRGTLVVKQGDTE